MKFLLLFFLNFTILQAGQMTYLNFTEEYGARPYGRYYVYNNNILTYMDDKLVLINQDLTILREGIKPKNDFIYVSPDKIFMYADTVIDVYVGEKWETLNYYQQYEGILKANDFTSLCYDSSQNIMMINSPGAYIRILQKDTLFGFVSEYLSNPYLRPFRLYNNYFFKGDFYFANSSSLLSKYIYPDTAQIFYKEDFIDLSRKIVYSGSYIPSYMRNLGDKLWISTSDGIITFYDGENFEKIDLMSGLSTEDMLENNYVIKDLNVDRDGNIWVFALWIDNTIWNTTSEQSIIRFDKSSGFTNYKTWLAEGMNLDEYAQNQHYRIEIDRHDITNQKVYIQNYSGFMIYDPDVTSIEENTNSVTNIFPNPATDFITISDDNIHKYQSYEIIDLMGRAVQSGTLEGDKIMLEDFPAGIYFLKLIGTTETKSMKFVVGD